MNNETLILEILETYEITPKLKRRIANIALQRQKNNSPEFNAVYDDIAFLIERFTADPRSISLDKPFSEYNKGNLYDILCKPNDAQDDKKLEEIDIRKGLHSLLKEEINPEEISFLETLLRNSNRDVRENQPITQNILERIIGLREKFSRVGRIIIPKRPIISVKFGPIAIKFGHRRYTKGPLHFFTEHKEDYQGLSRTELSRVDSGLYKSMVESGDIKIIPARHREYNGDPLAYYRANIERYQGMKRYQLCKFDQGLYLALVDAGQLDDAVPSSRTFYGDPLKYFQKHSEYHGLSRWELGKKNKSLYNALVKSKKIHLAIPETKRRAK